jgi:hypothetical protein
MDNPLDKDDVLRQAEELLRRRKVESNSNFKDLYEGDLDGDVNCNVWLDPGEKCECNDSCNDFIHINYGFVSIGIPVNIFKEFVLAMNLAEAERQKLKKDSDLKNDELNDNNQH